MPRHHDPFRQKPTLEVTERTKDQEGSEKEKEEKPPSAQGTIKGPPAGFKEEAELVAGLNDALENPFEEPKDAPLFEEPKVDEFGTGHGV